MKVEVDLELLKSLVDRLAILEQELRVIKTQIHNLYSEGGKEVLVATIRWVAPLAEVVRAGGVVTPVELSWFCRKYGKNPKGAAGYFTGMRPSMRSLDDDKRAITEDGRARVLQMEIEYGPDWLERVPLDLVGNPEVEGDTAIYL